MEQLSSLIENLGFPIVLSVYLLIRFEKKIDKLNETIIKLDNSIIELLRERIEDEEK